MWNGDPSWRRDKDGSNMWWWCGSQFDKHGNYWDGAFESGALSGSDDLWQTDTSSQVWNLQTHPENGSSSNQKPTPESWRPPACNFGTSLSSTQSQRFGSSFREGVPKTWAAPRLRSTEVKQDPSSSVSKGKRFNDAIINAETAHEILNFVEHRITEFHVINAATALHRLAKTDDVFDFVDDTRMTILRDRALHMFRNSVPKDELLNRAPGSSWKYHVDMRALTNTLWSQAKMNMRDPEMLEHTTNAIKARVSEGSPQQLSNCVWAIGKLSVRNEPLLAAVAEEASRRMEEFSPQNLMSVLWACAKLQFVSSALLNASAIAMIRRLGEASPQHLSIAAWSCATLGFRHCQLMDGIAQEAMRKMRLFSPQNIANLAWAFATLDLHHDRLFSAISLSARGRLHEFNQQHTCNLAWSLSSLQILDEDLLLAIAQEVMRQIENYDSQGLSNIACAFAVLGLAHHELFEMIATAATKLSHQCSPRDLESIAWAFAQLGIEKDHLMDAISKASLLKIHEFCPMDLANMAWAFATLGLFDANLMHALSVEIVKQGGKFSSQALAHIAWAFSVLGCASEALMSALSEEVRQKLQDLEVQHIGVLLDADLSCRDVLGRRMGAIIWRFLEAFPKTMDDWQKPDYAVFLKKLEINNFGLLGSQFLLERIGIRKAPRDFCERAIEEMHRYIRENNASLLELTSRDVLHKRCCIFAEFSFMLSLPDGKVINGAILRENGYWTASTARGGKCRWLQPAKGLKAGGLVDRTLCSEFQMLEELCDGFERDGAMFPMERRLAIEGGLRMFISTRPCISCVGAMSQFALMFPGIVLEVAIGKIPMRQGWKKDPTTI